MSANTDSNPKVPVGAPIAIVILLLLIAGLAYWRSWLDSGPFWFGVVIGFVTYRTLKHKKDAGISDIASVIGAAGGAAIVGLFPVAGGRFDQYAIGFAIGFFAFLLVLQCVALRSRTYAAAANKDKDRVTQFLDDDD
jgi:hypothetical protein